MPEKSFGNRLETVGKLIGDAGPFDCLCDIGSDHAFLPIRALKSGYARSAVASDLRPGPLERGKANAASENVSPVFVLSDGFGSLQGFDFDAVSVCGLGGETIAAILERGSSFVKKPGCRLFLQPMTAHDDLRMYLWNAGFAILNETFACERGRPYVVLTAAYTGLKAPFAYEDLFLGKVRPDTPEFRAYCGKVAAQTEKRMRAKEHPAADGQLLALARKLSGAEERAGRP